MLWAAPGNSAIVLPRQLADLLGDDQLRFIIAHELGHFVRHDHWANLFGAPGDDPLLVEPDRLARAVSWPRLPKHLATRLHWSDWPPLKSYAETLLAVVDFISATKPPRPARESRLVSPAP